MCCEVIIWAKFGPFQGLLSGPRSFLAYFCSVFKRFLHIQLKIVFFCPVIRQFSQKNILQKFCANFCVCVCVFSNLLVSKLILRSFFFGVLLKNTIK